MGQGLSQGLSALPDPHFPVQGFLSSHCNPISGNGLTPGQALQGSSQGSGWSLETRPAAFQ